MRKLEHWMERSWEFLDQRQAVRQRKVRENRLAELESLTARLELLVQGQQQQLPIEPLPGEANNN